MILALVLIAIWGVVSTLLGLSLIGAFSFDVKALDKRIKELESKSEQPDKEGHHSPG